MQQSRIYIYARKVYYIFENELQRYAQRNIVVTIY